MSCLEKKPDGPDRDLVGIYSLPRDKKAAAVFVGRQDIIQAIETNCRGAMRSVGNGENASGETFLVQGAPGAGKSALLAHLVQRWDGKEGCPMVMEMRDALLKDPSATALEIAKKIDPDKAERFRQRIVSSGSTSVRMPGIAEGGVSTSREMEGEEATFEVLASLKPPKNWKQPLCILVDEIQDVGEEHKACLKALQLGTHKLPIIPIYAGLADSEEKLRQAASPRLRTGNTRTLSALAPEEVHSCVKQMLDRCRIDYTPDQLERLAVGIAERSEGWPQHVRTETAALFRGLHQADCDLRSVDFDAVEKQAADYRKDSYQIRRSPEMKTCRSLVAAVMSAVPEVGMNKDEIIDAIERIARTDAGTSWCLPEGMNADMFLKHLVHQGALQPNRDRKWFCPIPSLRTWLIDRAPDARKRIAAEIAMPNSLQNAGRRKDEIEAAEELVELRRDKAKEDPGLTRELAGALVSLSDRLKDNNRMEETMEPVTEAVGLYRRLVEDDPGLTRELAGALVSLSDRLKDNNRMEETMEPVTEAVGLYRRLVEDDPGLTRELAGALVSLSDRLKDNNRMEEAMEPVTEAMVIFRRLAEE